MACRAAAEPPSAVATTVPVLSLCGGLTCVCSMGTGMLKAMTVVCTGAELPSVRPPPLLPPASKHAVSVEGVADEVEGELGEIT